MAGSYARETKDGKKVWYVRYKDRKGAWVSKRTTATSERECNKLAHALEGQAEKQRLELEASPGSFEGSFGALCRWAFTAHFSLLRGAQHDRVSLRRHGEQSRLGELAVAEVNSVELTKYFSELEHTPTVRGTPMGPATINRIRARFSKVFECAKEHGLFVFVGDNPALCTRSRSVPARPGDILSLDEIPRVLEALPDHWRGLFATCLYSGLRKGEAFALQKRDVNIHRRVMLIQRSHENDTTKGGRFETVPIHEDLVAYLEAALESAGPYVFPNEQGERRNRGQKLPPILRSALVRAGIVERYDHVCRRKLGVNGGEPLECGHVESHPDDGPRRCPKCNMKLWPVGRARNIRFHDTRHSFATHALESGASLVAVQKILRHQDPRLTTKTYGHLSSQHLQSEVNRIDFGLGVRLSGMAAEGMARMAMVADPPSPDASLGASERGAARGAPVELVTRPLRELFPVVEKGEFCMQNAVNSGVETAGIEPAAYALRKLLAPRPGDATGSQVAGITDNRFSIESKNSYQSGTVEHTLVTPVLRGDSYVQPCIPVTRGECIGGRGVQGEGRERFANPANPAHVVRQLSVAEVAELLSVSREWVRKRIERGELEHVRLGAHTRVPETALAAFLAKGQK
jgi:excisionase family DNA binding protein